MLSRGKTPTGEPHTVSHPKLRALHRAERLAVTWSAVAVVGCSMAVSGCGSARVVTGRTTNSGHRVESPGSSDKHDGDRNGDDRTAEQHAKRR